MGGVYAAMAGEAEEVQEAIREHYKPVAAGAELPATDHGAIISIADKMDTIAGCFGVGLIPTGAQDPYALRRAALGIIAIIRKRKFYGNDFSYSLDAFIQTAVKGIGEKLTREADEVVAEIIAFFRRAA